MIIFLDIQDDNKKEIIIMQQQKNVQTIGK